MIVAFLVCSGCTTIVKPASVLNPKPKNIVLTFDDGQTNTTMSLNGYWMSLQNIISRLTSALWETMWKKILPLYGE